MAFFKKTTMTQGKTIIKSMNAMGTKTERKTLSFSFFICVFCLMAFAVVLLSVSCKQENSSVANGVFETKEGTSASDAYFDLSDIQAGGELIVLTLYGPTSYFEFRGEDFGFQYKLADAFAKSIGVSVRVDVCRSACEMLSKLQRGDGDLVAYQMPKVDSLENLVAYCGTAPITRLIDSLAVVQRDRSVISAPEMAWAVRAHSTELADTLNHWLARNESDFFSLCMPVVAKKNSTYSSRRAPRSPVLNRAKGQISIYDHLFKIYSQQCSWDWRLLAAQAYQESAFDPRAVSWMGAMGLMQLMPSTARRVGVAESEVFDPDCNIRGAVRLIRTLDSHYSFITNRDERINFILAAYNAGAGHVDDARRIAQKYGRNPNVWRGHVDGYVLRMSESKFYNDSLSHHGYFRGSETYNYVNDIRARWQQYRSMPR